jgi:hypothetical protein
MENQTGFNLNAAIENWREELAAQSNLTAEMRRELETHVNDTVAELQRRGLNGEESFWLARRRVGQPKELGEEFGKADPAKACREGVLWIALAFFIMFLWQNLADGLWDILIPQNSEAIWMWQIAHSLNFLPVAWIAVSIARGRSIKKFAAWRSLIRSRGRFLVVACFSYLAIKAFALAVLLTRLSPPHEAQEFMRAFWWPLFSWDSLDSLAWPGALIAIIFWLLPAAQSPTLKRT